MRLSTIVYLEPRIASGQWNPKNVQSGKSHYLHQGLKSHSGVPLIVLFAKIVNQILQYIQKCNKICKKIFKIHLLRKHISVCLIAFDKICHWHRCHNITVQILKQFCNFLWKKKIEFQISTYVLSPIRSALK